MVTDAEGTPLGLTLSPANRHDSRMLEATLDAVPPVSGGKRGRPRRRPEKLHADKAYTGRPVREALRKRGITPRIARRGIEDSRRLGRHRWVVERTFAWMARFRRLVVRYERRADIHLAFATLAAPSSASANQSGGSVRRSAVPEVVKDTKSKFSPVMVKKLFPFSRRRRSCSCRPASR
jgi:transposase